MKQKKSFLLLPSSFILFLPMATQLIGRTIGPYRIVGFLGAGGMGHVYRARDERLDRDVAIKILPPSCTSDSDRLARFRREARMLAALNHSSIAAIYGYEEDNDCRALIMELVEGSTLAERISAGPIPMTEALMIGRQIAEALETAHEKGIVHRDLKPANIKVTPDGRVKVLDFGLAKTFDSVEAGSDVRTITAGPSEAGVVVGTAPYMSPEQTRGKAVDKRTDIWAFGCVLYEMLAGRRTFAGDTGPDVIANILERQPDWNALAPGTPDRIRQLLRRCLEKDPAQRLRDIGDAGLELNDLVKTDEPSRLALPAPSPGIRMNRVIGWGGVAVLAFAALWVTVPRDRDTARATPEKRLSDGNRPSANADANAYYERALLFGGAGTDDPRQARLMIDRALSLDPRFAAARAESAFYRVLPILKGQSNDASAFYTAEAEVRQALDDHPHCGRAHSVLALIYLLQGRKDLVPVELDKALEENPKDPTAHSWLLDYHRLNSDYRRARDEADWLNRESPVFWPGHLQLGELLREQGDLAGAIRKQEQVLEQNPKSVDALAELTRAFIESGNLQQARRTLERAAEEDRQNYSLRQQRALLLALEGNKSEAAQEMDSDLQTYAGIQVFGAALAADFYAVMGETDKAFDWLDRAVRMGDDREEYMKRNPLLASLRTLPRFQQIVEAVAYRRQQRAGVGPTAVAK